METVTLWFMVGLVDCDQLIKRKGLLDVAEITASGYQLYSPSMVARAQRIMELQAKRLTLTEIRRELFEAE